VYLDWLEIKRRKLSTARSSSGGSGEGRLGVRAIPAEGSRGWIGSGREAGEEGGEAVGRGNLGGVARLGRIPVRKSGSSSVSRGGRKGKAAGERGV
jgi:hypothetical protein